MTTCGNESVGRIVGAGKGTVREHITVEVIAYESDNNNNWDVIEKFAEYIGNRGDIWYATNIEIYNYAKAYESLITSYDRKIIYNPSAIDIWVFVDGKTLLVKSGKTFYQTKIIDVKNS